MSISTESILSSLQPGDVVKLIRTVKVTRVDGKMLDYEDVADGSNHWLNVYLDNGSLKVEMVKRKPRKVKAGDVLPADEFRSRPWKPGTLVEHATIKNHQFVLLGEGEWVNLTDSSYAYKIEDFTSEDGYRLVYVA